MIAVFTLYGVIIYSDGGHYTVCRLSRRPNRPSYFGYHYFIAIYFPELWLVFILTLRIILNAVSFSQEYSYIDGSHFLIAFIEKFRVF